MEKLMVRRISNKRNKTKVNNQRVIYQTFTNARLQIHTYLLYNLWFFGSPI